MPGKSINKSSKVILTVHRSAHEIGGNCIEIEHGKHRLILDAGSPLQEGTDMPATLKAPSTLNLKKPVDALVISHPHKDHYGLLGELPKEWPVWSGKPTEILIRISAAVEGHKIQQKFNTYKSREPFIVGPFTITPYLTDHSAFDAHMLEVKCAGKRILYSGDFRRTGRKKVLVSELMNNPPLVDILILEGTNIGHSKRFEPEYALESKFQNLFNRTKGRVFITWSAQNIDRTVTIYRACRKARRALILDLYTLYILDHLSKYYPSLPRQEFKYIKCVITKQLIKHFRSPNYLNDPDFVEKCANSRNKAMSAAKLANLHNAVIMLRPSLLKDFINKGLQFTKDDAWVFSMWESYLEKDEFKDIREKIDKAGATFDTIHSSGHASGNDLKEFARKLAPAHIIPIHGDEWDNNIEWFSKGLSSKICRLKDGEPFPIP